MPAAAKKKPVVDPEKLVDMLANHETRLVRLERLERARHQATPLDRFPIVRLVRDQLLSRVDVDVEAGEDAAEPPTAAESSDGDGH